MCKEGCGRCFACLLYMVFKKIFNNIRRYGAIMSQDVQKATFVLSHLIITQPYEGRITIILTL